MPTVVMPDGTHVEMPDDPTPEQLGALSRLTQNATTAAKPPPSIGDALPGWLRDFRSKQFPAFPQKTQEAPAALPLPGTPLPQNAGIVDTASHYGGLAASAIGRGLAAIPGMAAEAGNFLSPRKDPILQPGEALRMSTDFGQQPANVPEKYLNSAVEGAAGAMAGPGGLAKNAMIGGASGLGSEGAAQAFGDHWWTRLLGGLAGGTGASLASTVRRTGPDLVREATRDTSQADLEAARKAMEEQAATGQGTINASQAMGKPSGLDSLITDLANSKNGTSVQAQLRNQPQQVQLAAEGAVADLPGDILTPHIAANEVQDAATTAVNQAKRARTDLWEKTVKDQTQPVIDAAEAKLKAATQAAVDADQAYAAKFPQTTRSNRTFMNPDERAMFDKWQAAKASLEVAQAGVQSAGHVPSQAVMEEVRRLGQISRENVNTEVAAQAQKLASQLVADGKPITDPIMLNNALKSYTDVLKQPALNTSGVSAGTVKYMQNQVNAIRDNLGKGFEPIRKANEAFGGFTDNVVNPLKQSVTGRLAGQSGYDPAKEAALTKLTAVFDKGTVPGTKGSEILTLQRDLAKTPQGNETFVNGFKTWIAGKLSDAAVPKDNRVPDSIAGNLTRVFGDPAQATAQSQGTKDMLAAAAKASGKDPVAVTRGFEQFQRFAAAAAKRPAAVGDSSKDLAATASGGAQEGLRDNMASALFGLRRWFSEARGGDARRFVDSLVTTPEGMETLIKLSKQPVMSNAAANTLATFKANLATSQDQSGAN